LLFLSYRESLELLDNHLDRRHQSYPIVEIKSNFRYLTKRKEKHVQDSQVVLEVVVLDGCHKSTTEIEYKLCLSIKSNIYCLHLDHSNQDHHVVLFGPDNQVDQILLDNKIRIVFLLQILTTRITIVTRWTRWS